MDNLTHTLTGVALSQAGLNRKTRFATLAMILGSNAPDVDIVARFGGGASYLKYHRGITHSIPGVILLAAVVVAIVYVFGRQRRSLPGQASTGATGEAHPPKQPSAPALNPRWLFAACLIATSVHLLMDFTNDYGVRPFLPFSGRWHAWDVVFIVDPVLLGLLAAGIGLPAIFRLISEEVGARKSPPRGGAIFALCAMLALWGLRDFAHRRALSMLDSRTYGDENPLRLGAFPSPANPFAWSGLVETASSYYLLPVDARADNVDPARATVLRKPETSAPLEAALQTRTGVIYSDFARFLWSEVTEQEGGFEVRLHDLRFYSPDSRLPGFTAVIRLDQNLRVRSEWFGFSGQGPAD